MFCWLTGCGGLWLGEILDHVNWLTGHGGLWLGEI